MNRFVRWVFVVGTTLLFLSIPVIVVGAYVLNSALKERYEHERERGRDLDRKTRDSFERTLGTDRG